jgi:predicted RNA binding protein with dsRBD fold (UPF0201 family)
MSNSIEEPTYVEIVCEARLNSTETEETIRDILRKFLPGEANLDSRFDGTFVVVRTSGLEELQIFGDWVRELRLLDTVRERLIRSITGNITALYFNRQAAAMDRIALVDLNDEPPLGPVVLQIVSDSLMFVADKITPRTWKGKELSEEEWHRLQQRQERIRIQKQRDLERRRQKEQKYHQP